MSELAKFIEHTMLKPDTTRQDVLRLSEEALRFGFEAVCIPPPFVKDARQVLGDRSKVKLVTVAGFPMGYSTIAAKNEEIKRAMEDGADDVDAVINLALVKSGLWNHVSRDIEGLALATQSRSGNLKLILECGFLTAEELKQVCAFAAEAGISWLKTGTGYHGFNATPEMIRNLHTLAPKSKIKASGGINDAATARSLINAGAVRIGTSAGIEIISELVPA